mmetsp:Transcript_29524/g.71931  ORF Transcript_29524/g.71931 Transcript_29524/m.71931 type:complete len:182 (+) Transcript_29524:379-924(+)
MKVLTLCFFCNCSRRAVRSSASFWRFALSALFPETTLHIPYVVTAAKPPYNMRPLILDFGMFLFHLIFGKPPGGGISCLNSDMVAPDSRTGENSSGQRGDKPHFGACFQDELDRLWCVCSAGEGEGEGDRGLEGTRGPGGSGERTGGWFWLGVPTDAPLSAGCKRKRWCANGGRGGIEDEG